MFNPTKLLALALLSTKIMLGQGSVPNSPTPPTIPFSIQSYFPGACMYGQYFVYSSGSPGTNLYACGFSNDWHTVTPSAGSAAFGSLASGTNNSASMLVGSGASLGVSGSGVLNANQFNGAAVSPSLSCLGTNSLSQLVSGSCSGSGSSPAGSSGALQYNNSGSFGGLGLGTTTTVYHGNASGVGTFAPVNLTSDISNILPVANGGTGTSTPSLVQGANITITGTWPNQTIASSGTGGGGYYQAFYHNGSSLTPRTQFNMVDSAGGNHAVTVTFSDSSSPSQTTAVYDVAVGPSGALDCTTNPYCDVVTAVVPLKASANAWTGQNNFANEAAGSTPFRTGASLPATCTANQDVFYLTTASAGQNIYSCTSTNTWTLEGSSGGGVTLATAGVSADWIGGHSSGGQIGIVSTLVPVAALFSSPYASRTITNMAVYVVTGVSGASCVAGFYNGASPYSLVGVQSNAFAATTSSTAVKVTFPSSITLTGGTYYKVVMCSFSGGPVNFAGDDTGSDYYFQHVSGVVTNVANGYGAAQGSLSLPSTLPSLTAYSGGGFSIAMYGAP